MYGDGHARSEFVACDEIRGFNYFIAAAYRACKGVKPKIDGKLAPGGLLDGAETRFRRIAKGDAGGWNRGSGQGRSDGKREKALVIERREIETEAAKIIGDKNGAANFRVDGFANAVSEEEAKDLYKTFAVPASGAPLFQAATANLNPWTEAKVDIENPERGPLLITSGEKDNTAPWAIANASFKRQQRNVSVTEIIEIPNRGHGLTVDSGWREVADISLAFIRRFV